MQLPYQSWEPDLEAPGSGLSVCEGVTRIATGYAPFPQLLAPDGAAALSGTPRGIIAVQASDGNYYQFAATASVIAKMSSTYTWSDIDTLRSVPTGEDVSFCLFGEYLLNTDTADGFKAYHVVTPAGNNAVSGAPDANFIFSCGNTVFALQDGTSTRRFGNSDFRNHTKWAGGVANGNTLDDGGGALTGGADQNNGFGLMMQEKAIRGIQWSGTQYSLPKIADGLGCVHGRTVTSFNGMVAFWSEDGPVVVDGQSAPVAIGAEKINRWAAENIGRQNFKNLQGTVDPQRKTFMWRLNEGQILTWCWLPGLNDFTILPVTTAALTRIATPPVAINSLTGTVDSLSGSINSLGSSSAPTLGGLNSSLKFSTFSGQNMAATIETAPVNTQATGMISRATPIDDCATGTLQVGVSDRLDASLTWKTGASKVSDGSVPLRARGHNVAFRRNIPAGATWSFASGIDHLKIAQGGRR